MFQISAKSQYKWKFDWGGKGEGGGTKGLHSKILISIIIAKHMQMFCFKFQQNRTINEEFDFFEE